MANPRKFSEKIALHTHRQAEETARFEQIMREVSDVRMAPERSSSKNTLRINTQALGTFRGGSLPNVSAGAPTTKASSNNTESAKQPEETPHINTVNYRVGSRARSQGGPIRRPHDRKLDTSPYSSSSYLSLPSDTSWRRTNSDSALHQSAMQGMNVDRNDSSNRGWMMPNNGQDRNDGRPRSSCEIPRVHIYPSAHQPGIQIPICGNNTGSLPDLTNVDFSSPIHAPLDQDQDQGSSPYSSNHLSVPDNSRFHQHHNKTVPLDKNLSNLVDNTDFTQLGTMPRIYQPQCSPPSPTNDNYNSFPINANCQPFVQLQQQSSGYRSPRPSPQSSPSLGGRHSAPCSPGAPSPLPNDYHIFNHQATQFQQHFEQLSMLDTPVSYVDQPPSGHMTQSHPQTLPEVSSTIGNIEITSDAGYYSTSPSSQLVYQTASPSLHTTPNTPTSIPDIILTDFSASDDTKQLEPDDLFSEEALRDGLGPLDFDGLQMLADPSINLPDSVEDHFRLDRS